MKTTIGCTNAGCKANEKKHKYKKTDVYCTKCGNKLSYVCADCFMELSGPKKYCTRCEAAHNDNNVPKIVAGAAVVAAAKKVANVGVDVIKKISK